ncbi:MAG: hypothetical protein QW203_05980 [Thermoplasmatales archaeon]
MDRRKFEKYTEEQLVKRGCIVQREFLRATYINGGKLVARPSDFFSGTTDVIAICDDGVHLIQVTSGSRNNVTERQRKFDSIFTKEYPGVNLEVWHYVKGRKYILNRRIEGNWQQLGVLR